MALSNQVFNEQLVMTEMFTVLVTVVMNEQIGMVESFIRVIIAAIFYNLTGRKPNRYIGLPPGRGG